MSLLDRYVAKKFVELHHGKIWVESAAERRTLFLLNYQLDRYTRRCYKAKEYILIRKEDETDTKGLWVGFCGIDGAGKSTQAALLCGWLTQNGIPNLLREGKRDFVSEMASAIARSHGAEGGRRYFGEEYYMVALSFDLLREAVLDVRPFLVAATTVVSARTAFCRLAGGLLRDCRSLELAKEVALFGGIPDIVIWLDTSPEVAHQRVVERGLDIATVEHLRLYRAAVGVMLQGYPHIRVDGDGSVDSVRMEVQTIIEKALSL